MCFVLLRLLFCVQFLVLMLILLDQQRRNRLQVIGIRSSLPMRRFGFIKQRQYLMGITIYHGRCGRVVVQWVKSIYARTNLTSILISRVYAGGGVGAQFWSVYVPVSTATQNNALTATLEQIAVVRELTKQYSDVFELALTAEDVTRIRGNGKIASLIGVEGGHSIENSLNVLRQLYREGARYMTLTHSMSLDWADSCSDEPISGGLSAFGEEIVHEMNRLGMIVDLSHVSPACMRKALETTQAPVVFSHSSARAVADHPRNVPNDVLLLTKENGGVVMVNFFSDFVNPVDAARSRKRTDQREKLNQLYPDDEDKATSELRQWELKNPRSKQCTVHDLLDHIDQIVNVAGIDHVGLGSDYDGVPALPAQLGDVSTYPVITQGLLDRGYTEAEIRKVLGGNVLRVFRQVEQVSSKLLQQKQVGNRE